jgi:PKD repeat protein
MSRPCIPIVLCMAIVFVAVIAVPVAADNVTPTETVTATTTTVPVTTTATPAPTQTTVIPTTTVTTTVPSATATATPVPTATSVLATTTATSVIPAAGFTTSTISGTAPLTVQFTDTSANSPTSWSWNFGDGNTSTVENPSFTYTTAGTYSVTLSASNAAGATVDTQSGLITVNTATTPPVADFTQSVSSGTNPLTVQFTDDSTNSPTSWSWSFGDGNTSTAENPSYIYATAGSYTVSLTATNAGGSNSTAVTEDVIVAQGTSVIPVASFTESGTTGAAPLTVRFTDDSENSPTSWSWYFGDGEASTDENPLHTYTNPGNFVVTLTAMNGAGSNQSIQQDIIRVSAAPAAVATFAPVATATPEPTPPPVSFEGTPTSGPAPLVVKFTPAAPGSPESFAWDFGDGGTSTEREPTYTYTSSGTYTVTLTVKYPAGSRPSEKESYIVVAGDSTTSSPLSPAIPLLALGIAGLVSLMIAGRRHR